MIYIIQAIIVAAAATYSVSAWTTTSHNAIMKKSSINNWRGSYRRQVVVVVDDSNHGQQTMMYRRSKLQALPDDDIVSEEDGDDTPERRRKRDILKRTLGLSSGSGSENNSSNSDGVKKLNTDNLFKGMPPINSILGGQSSTLPNVGMTMPPDDTTTTTTTEDESTTTKFEKQGQLQKELDLLTPDEKAQLDGKYNIIREQSERLIEEELLKGKDGELGIDDESLNTGKKKKSMDSEDISDDAAQSDEDGGKLLDITNEEAKRIVDYAVEEDKLAEKRMLNEQKKQELIQTWENESLMAEQSIEDQFTSSSANNSNNEEIINNDAIAREIISNANERDLLEETKQKQLNDLNFYSRQLQQRKDVEGVVTKATESFYQEDGSIMDVDIDAVYEETLSQIQSSRKDRLGPKSFGVLSNSIALEEGREYIMKQKEQKEFLASVEREAGLVDASDEDVTMFFKPPVNLVEERMYRSIVRQIVDKREEEEEVNALESDETLDPAEEGWDGGGSPSFDNNKKMMKYQLTPKETVEAYKLLNLWRTIQKQQDEMEIALGMKDDVNEISNRRPLNKLEPYFLYEEDTEEKRQKEKENLTKILQKGLASEDDVEKSSNELLMKELLEGGVTKDRAVRLLDKLMNKVGLDDTIRESLEELRVTLLEEDDSDGDWTAEAEEDRPTSALLRKRKSGGPIDLSSVFRTSDIDEDEVEESTTSSSSSPSLFYNEPPPESLRGVERTVASWGGTEEEEKEEEDTSSSYEPPPPNTPFFQDVGSEGEAASSRREDTSPAGGMFGTYEEQRLKKLANKVGAETEEEMEELRRNMEALREAEEMADAKLSNDDFDIEAASSKLGIDVNSLNLDDDNDDQIMSILGKRPGSSSSSSSSASAADLPPSTSYPPKEALLELNEDDQMIKEDIIVDAAGHLKRMKEKKETDIVDDIFRAKTAGRQYQDRDTRNADEAAFRDFMKMEEDAIEAVDSISDDDETIAEDLDLDEYAEDIMSEMKPRPSRPKREDFMSREDLQKERRKESLFGDDPFPINESQQSAPSSSSSSSGDGFMPEWFHKEQEELGINVDDMNDSEFDEARMEWEREERQRKADEYLKERGEGISISDVLGREYFGPMDEPDYEDTRDLFDSFLARKDLLLGYTELTVEDINNVVDFKVDPLATGYNKYLSKVQRPFSEYGSIFRLEGVLVDMIGMHAKAWKHVSDKHGYTLQSRDEIRQASLYKPVDAVREVFRWTDDIYELQDIAQTHQDAFQEAFNAWLQTGGNVLPASDEQSSVGSGTDSSSTGSNAMPSNEEMDSMYYLAWSKLANNMDKQAPTTDEVNRGIMGGDWEVAVKDIFGWSDDATEVYDIVVAYDEILQADYRILLNKYGINLDKINAQEEESLFGLDFPDLELHGEVFEFLDVLREVDMPVAIVSHLPRGDLDVVLNATGLVDYFPVDKRVSLDDSYQSERSELLGAALRLEQRPDQCIVFDNTPLSADVAHGVDMKSVSFVNHYARYELLTADLSVGYVADLELSSLVKLFDKREDLEPLLELDVDSGMQKYQRKAKTAFWDE